jgi:chromosome segregation ATPase
MNQSMKNRLLGMVSQEFKRVRDRIDKLGPHRKRYSDIWEESDLSAITLSPDPEDYDFGRHPKGLVAELKKLKEKVDSLNKKIDQRKEELEDCAEEKEKIQQKILEELHTLETKTVLKIMEASEADSSWLDTLSSFLKKAEGKLR